MDVEDVHGRRRVANQTKEGEMNNWIGGRLQEQKHARDEDIVGLEFMMFYCSGVVNVLE
jgi:hypothetical protein